MKIMCFMNMLEIGLRLKWKIWPQPLAQKMGKKLNETHQTSQWTEPNTLQKSMGDLQGGHTTINKKNQLHSSVIFEYVSENFKYEFFKKAQVQP